LRYTVEDIAGIVGGTLIKGIEVSVELLLTDSRKVIFPSTCLFFALQGPRRDGHRFIGELYQKGVRSFVVSGSVDTASFPEANFIIVTHTLHALHLLAVHHRYQFDIPTLGITGSNGKTIVKEWLNHLLEERYTIVRSPKSYNSQLGVPLSVWQMNPTHQLAIFEAGISQPGEMTALEKMIRPSIGIITNIGEAHSEGFSSLRHKASEKLALFHNASAIIYCSDYEVIDNIISAKQHQGFLGKIFTWSRNKPATLQIIHLENTGETSVITSLYQGKQGSIHIPFTDDASIENAITCWCVLLLLGVPSEEIETRMRKLSPVAMRLELKRGINNCSIINDSYSADISSLRIALDFLNRLHYHQRKTVILSDLPGAGKQQVELYKQIAGFLASRNIKLYPPRNSFFKIFPDFNRDFFLT
jgi:Alr-MurF fusion protein